MMLGTAERYVGAEPSAFMETICHPKVVTRELASLAKLRSLREEYLAARPRFVKALLAAEEETAERSKR